jgi:predicted nucleic acid-binding Zn ribbon protein
VLEDVTIPEDMLPVMHSMFPLQGSNAFSVLSAPSSNLPGDHPGANGKRYFTIQRVNGTGAQGQGLGCGHQHTIEDSDRVKKNSVQRILLKEDKERKRNMVCFFLLLSLRISHVQRPRWLGIPAGLALTSQSRSVVTHVLHW